MRFIRAKSSLSSAESWYNLLNSFPIGNCAIMALMLRLCVNYVNFCFAVVIAILICYNVI